VELANRYLVFRLNIETFIEVACMLGFSLCLFALYSITPYLMIEGSATVFNLSILTSDGFAILVAVFLFDHVVTLLLETVILTVVSRQSFISLPCW
jgi:hypothetical protein